jgi:hypothetical protein
MIWMHDVFVCWCEALKCFKNLEKLEKNQFQNFEFEKVWKEKKREFEIKIIKKNPKKPQPSSPFPFQSAWPNLTSSSGPRSHRGPTPPPLSLPLAATRPHSSALSPSSSPPLPHIRPRPPVESRRPSVFPSFKASIQGAVKPGATPPP